MNSNLAEVGKPTRWPPGRWKTARHSDSPLSQGFIRDFALVWAEEGLEAVRKVAKKSPEAFVAIAAAFVRTMSALRLNKPFLGETYGRFS